MEKRSLIEERGEHKECYEKEEVVNEKKKRKNDTNKGVERGRRICGRGLGEKCFERLENIQK